VPRNPDFEGGKAPKKGRITRHDPVVPFSKSMTLQAAKVLQIFAFSEIFEVK